MKKLIAISVVFALLTGAAFAQVELSADMWAEVNLIHGNTDNDDLFASGGRQGDDGWNYAKLTFSYETPGGEAGISGIFENDSRPGEGNGGVLAVDGAAWWKPVPQLKLLIGGADFDRGDDIGWTDMSGGMAAAAAITAAAGTGAVDPNIALLIAQYSWDVAWLEDDFDPSTLIAISDQLAYLDFKNNFDSLLEALKMFAAVDPEAAAAAALSQYFGMDYSKYIRYEAGSGNWFGLSIMPMDMFTLNIAVVEKDPKDILGAADVQYGKVFMAQAVIQIPGGFGEIALTYDNAYGDDYALGALDKDGKPKDTNNAFFFDYVGDDLMGLGLDVRFGFSYFMNASKSKYSGDYDQWFMGLYAGYTVMEGLKAAFLFDTWAFEIVGVGAEVDYSMDLSPWTFSLYGKLFANIFINSDLEKGFKALTGETTYFKWEVEPKLSQNIGGFDFSAALNISGDNIDDGVNISVPVRFAYKF